MLKKGDRAIWLPRSYGKISTKHPWYNKEVIVLGVEQNQYGRLRVQVVNPPKGDTEHNYCFWADPGDLKKILRTEGEEPDDN